MACNERQKDKDEACTNETKKREDTGLNTKRELMAFHSEPSLSLSLSLFLCFDIHPAQFGGGTG
jgi:hypothetical protein